ncbi:hypothetical protein V2G26_001390 [Clonostachys chloroleuca]|uniref:Uncharacterized protein n=1 Tax=Clonostachys chloroleuca TaxID=1926264 RepID=A0AA35V9Y6_9HYPO|nr:unnamed protein product [Clonostachys chloroleuca]
MAASTPIPIILCGKTEQIGQGVIEGLKPEFEVVQFIMNPGAVITEVPFILRGEAPESSSSSIGTGNVAAGVRAVLLGGAFDDATIFLIRTEIARSITSPKLPWVRQDMEKPAPPLGPEYGKAMVARSKEALLKLQAEGKLDGTDDGLYYY